MPLTINKRGHEIDCEAKAVTVGGRLETTFRTAKHLLATTPIFHRLDETIRGHVFASFLALVVKAELEQRIADLGRAASWTESFTDLDSLTETAIAHDHKRFLVRSSPRAAASLALGPPASPCRRPSSPSPATDPPSKCSATPPPRRRLPCIFSNLTNRTVKDGQSFFKPNCPRSV